MKNITVENIIENQRMMREVNFCFKLTTIYELITICIGISGVLVGLSILNSFVPFLCSLTFIIFLLKGLMKKDKHFIMTSIIVHGIAVISIFLSGPAFMYFLSEFEFNKIIWFIDIFIFSISFILNIKAYTYSKQNDYLKTLEGYPNFNQLCMEMKNKHFTAPKFEFDYSHDGTMEEITPPEI